MPPYNKPALSVAQQLALLKARGMAIQDDAKAEFYLTHINYYRLRAYWLPFEDPATAPNHLFRQGSNFDDVLSIYIFDRELRLLVLDAIERVEVSFRASFANYLGMAYGSHAHIDPAIFDPRFHPRCLQGLNDEIRRSREDFILHYNRTYSAPSVPPIWASTEVMSFGLLSQWYNAILRRGDRNNISALWGLDERFTVSLLRHLSSIRNFCAHHSRLWNRRFAVTMQIPHCDATLRASMNPNSTRQIHNALAVLAWLLGRISPGQTWSRRVVDHINSHPSVNPLRMGFPVDWKTKAPWA